MLIGPYSTFEEAFAACNGSSSSSSDDSSSSSSSSGCSSENCSADITLTGPCGLELSGGVVYSIGTQTVSVSNFSDDCECLMQIYINELPVPYDAYDGEALSITVSLNDDCHYSGQDNPICVIPMFGISQIKGSKVTLKLLPSNMLRYLLSRRKVKGAS
jgi:hypothetical protein